MSCLSCADGVEDGSLIEFWNPGRCLLGWRVHPSPPHSPQTNSSRDHARAGQPRHQARKPPPRNEPERRPPPLEEKTGLQIPHTKAALPCLSGSAGRLSRFRASEQRHTTHRKGASSPAHPWTHTRSAWVETWLTCLLPPPPRQATVSVRPLVPLCARARWAEAIPVVIALAPVLTCPATMRTTAHVEHGLAVRGDHWLGRPSQPSLVPPLLRGREDLPTPFQGSLVPPGQLLSNHGCMAVGEALIMEALHASLLLLRRSARAGVSAKATRHRRTIMVEDETVIGLRLSTVHHLRSRLPGHMSFACRADVRGWGGGEASKPWRVVCL